MNTTEVKEMIPNRYGSGVAGMDADHRAWLQASRPTALIR